MLRLTSGQARVKGAFVGLLGRRGKSASPNEWKERYHVSQNLRPVPWNSTILFDEHPEPASLAVASQAQENRIVFATLKDRHRGPAALGN